MSTSSSTPEDESAQSTKKSRAMRAQFIHKFPDSVPKDLFSRANAFMASTPRVGRPTLPPGKFTPEQSILENSSQTSEKSGVIPATATSGPPTDGTTMGSKTILSGPFQPPAQVSDPLYLLSYQPARTMPEKLSVPEIPKKRGQRQGSSLCDPSCSGSKILAGNAVQSVPKREPISAKDDIIPQVSESPKRGNVSPPTMTSIQQTSFHVPSVPTMFVTPTLSVSAPGQRPHSSAAIAVSEKGEVPSLCDPSSSKQFPENTASAIGQPKSTLVKQNSLSKNLPVSASETPIFITRRVHPYADAPERTVNIREYRANGAPGPTLGAPGDTYIDWKDKDNIAFYGKTAEGWAKWAGPQQKSHDSLIAHLLFPTRFLWACFGGAAGWMKIDVIEADKEKRSASLVLQDMLSAPRKRRDNVKRSQSSANLPASDRPTKQQRTSSRSGDFASKTAVVTQAIPVFKASMISRTSPKRTEPSNSTDTISTTHKSTQTTSGIESDDEIERLGQDAFQTSLAYLERIDKLELTYTQATSQIEALKVERTLLASQNSRLYEQLAEAEAIQASTLDHNKALSAENERLRQELLTMRHKLVELEILTETPTISTTLELDIQSKTHVSSPEATMEGGNELGPPSYHVISQILASTAGVSPLVHASGPKVSPFLSNEIIKPNTTVEMMPTSQLIIPLGTSYISSTTSVSLTMKADPIPATPSFPSRPALIKSEDSEVPLDPTQIPLEIVFSRDVSGSVRCRLCALESSNRLVMFRKATSLDELRRHCHEFHQQKWTGLLKMGEKELHGMHDRIGHWQMR
ncbi:hypothetical protein C8J56DRAFT_1171433 [Mycena floridula]|nr:hypothetical protein C8J56DRAFT_1171433 [Mycena floridula]